MHCCSSPPYWPETELLGCKSQAGASGREATAGYLVSDENWQVKRMVETRNEPAAQFDQFIDQANKELISWELCSFLRFLLCTYKSKIDRGTAIPVMDGRGAIDRDHWRNHFVIGRHICVQYLERPTKRDSHVVSHDGKRQYMHELNDPHSVLSNAISLVSGIAQTNLLDKYFYLPMQLQHCRIF